MAIVFISSTSAELRKEVAESLARKLGYPCLSREELVDQATEAGIPVGKLEMSVIKMPAPSERLARLKERFLTFVTAGICDRAGEKNLIYHGRGGIFSCRISPMSSAYDWYPTQDPVSRPPCFGCVWIGLKRKNTSGRWIRTLKDGFIWSMVRRSMIPDSMILSSISRI